MAQINPQTGLPYTLAEQYILNNSMTSQQYGPRNSLANTSSYGNEPSAFNSNMSQVQPTQQTQVTPSLGNMYQGNTQLPQLIGSDGKPIQGTGYTPLNETPSSGFTYGNAIDAANVGIGLGSLGANIYYAEQNKKAQEDARNYARSRDAMADAKTNKFQRNLV